MKPTPYDYTTVLASFFEAAGELPAHNHSLKPVVESAARRALEHPDSTFMPAFKVLDLLSGLVNLCIGIAREPHLRVGEAKAMLQNLVTDDAPLLRTFYREAALERVRYEPVMLTETYTTPLDHRNALLTVRFKRMREIYESAGLLDATTAGTITRHATHAMQNADFITYRAGPMCQLFADMLRLATERTGADLDTLIGPQSALWKSFRLKSNRYRADDSDPLITGVADHIDSPIPVTHHLH